MMIVINSPPIRCSSASTHHPSDLRLMRSRMPVFSTSERTTPAGYFDTESFDNPAKASCTVVINRAGKMMVEFFSTEISAIDCSVRS
jgi:hypothetical protein